MTWAVDLIKGLGITRGIILLFLVGLWILATLATSLPLTGLFADCLIRTGMNGVLVLALVPAVRAGVGLNFGIPLGIVCGLFGMVTLMDMNIRGYSSLFGAMVLGGGIGALAGFLYARLLERVKGQEMMVGIYVGFAAVAGASIYWLVAPVKNPELVWPLGGAGLRNTLVLADYYSQYLDKLGAIPFGTGYIPTGLLAFWLGMCGLLALFLKTKMGTALTAAGANERFAEASGINVTRMRTIGVILSTVLGAIGIVIYSQSYGFVQLYKGPLLMAFPTVAALLIGGATVRNATITHVIIGTFLFQSVLTTSLPVVNEIVAKGGSEFGNIPEIARLIISNGIILYALTRKESA
ncbi:MAG: ABC transporter permease [Candidatus Eisenbacteria bacterium]|uniref:ABC transporter permease n=1 Tax=Eiseniibacteriota bacterium TaxID=2212470 RepID=A0A7Y2EFK9_UNCEI|nr:ABC transporter permease [Candidatus Eisenbacteria bacterium]